MKKRNLLSFSHFLHTAKSGFFCAEKRLVWHKNRARFTTRHVLMSNTTRRVWNFNVECLDFVSAKKCAKTRKNDLFCKVQTSIINFDLRIREHNVLIVNALLI